MSQKKKNPEIFSILLKEHEVFYQVKKGRKNSHRIYFKITPDALLILTVPERVKEYEIRSIIQDKENWILNKIKEINSHPENLSVLLKNGYLFYHGEKLPIQILEEENRLRSFFKKKSDQFVLKIPSGLNFFTIKSEVIKGLKRLAKTELKIILDEISTEMRVKYNRLSIKDTKTRWGSCSSLRNINLSWRLIMAPEHICRYVVLHELCHIIEPNHSKKYWKVVRKYLPEYKEYEKWLKKNSWFFYSL